MSILTLYDNAYTTGLPINTVLAPSARALKISVPLRTPPSMYTSQRPFAAATTLGNASIYMIISNN